MYIISHVIVNVNLSVRLMLCVEDRIFGVIGVFRICNVFTINYIITLLI